MSSNETLPPTSSSIRMHIKRAIFATYQMVSLTSPRKALDPRQFGFELDGELLVPSRGSNPIPDDLAIWCTCKKCATQRCPCHKTGNPCCTFCTCQSDPETGTFVCQNIFGVINNISERVLHTKSQVSSTLLSK